MITLQNVTNAFVKLDHNGRYFLADPWISDGIFDGGWSPYPPIRDSASAVKNCDYLYISHIHEDHFDLAALERLPKNCTVIIPDLFPNHLIQQRVAKLGFTNILMLRPFTPIEIDKNLTVEVIPPLNAFGQELAYYGKDVEGVAIDTGLMITWDGIRIILLNDNTPYDLSLFGDALKRFIGVDLLAFNYNGGADDYPVCFRNLTDQEKKNLCEHRDNVKLEATKKLIRALKPKALMPYSSDFSVCGRQAKEFTKIRTSWHNSKQLVAEHLAKSEQLPSIALFEADRLEIDERGIRKIRGSASYPDALERAEVLFNDRPNYVEKFPAVTDLAVLRKDARAAADHMFRFMDKYNWSSSWILELQIVEDPLPLYIDLQSREVSDKPASPSERKILRCFVDARYLGALIRRLTHWNNAMISYNLEWERIPNEYDPFLYKALNFFHL